MEDPNNPMDDDLEFVKTAFLKNSKNIKLPSSLTGANLIVKYKDDLKDKKYVNKLFSSKKRFWSLTACAACLILGVTFFINNDSMKANMIKPMAQKSMPKIPTSPPKESAFNKADFGSEACNDEIMDDVPQVESFLFDKGETSVDIISPAQIIENQKLICNSFYLTMEDQEDDVKTVVLDNDQDITSLIAIVRSATPCDAFAEKNENLISCNLNFESGETQLFFYAEPEHFEWLDQTQNLSYSVKGGTYKKLSNLILNS